MEKGYHKLLVWQKARELVKLIYHHTKAFPRSEEFGLQSQLRRAVVSIVLNIVEGYRRNSTRDYCHFLNIADASLSEVEAALELALDLEYLTKETYEIVENKRKEVGYLLFKLIQSLRK